MGILFSLFMTSLNFFTLYMDQLWEKIIHFGVISYNNVLN